jgi:hypothetical protein
MYPRSGRGAANRLVVMLSRRHRLPFGEVVHQDAVQPTIVRGPRSSISIVFHSPGACCGAASAGLSE